MPAKAATCVSSRIAAQDAAERRASHALHHEKHEAKHDKTEDEVSEIEIGAERGLQRLRDTRNAVSPAREPNLVLSDDAHHLGKTERNDREIVVAQPCDAERDDQAAISAVPATAAAKPSAIGACAFTVSSAEM